MPEKFYRYEYRKCSKPDCLRLVSLSSTYCCGPCAVAAAGTYEIEKHSEGCEERAAERGPWLTPLQELEQILDRCAERRAEGRRPRAAAATFPRPPSVAAADEPHQRWVAEVARKLRAAMARAAEGRTFIWDEPAPAPGAYTEFRMSDGLWTSDLKSWHTAPAGGAR